MLNLKMNEELKTELGINEWLELIKEDKNLNGAYISICQYIYLTEKENQKLKNNKIKDDKLINSLNDFNYKLKQQYELLELNYLKQKKENKKLEEELEKFNKIKEMFESGVVDLVELKNIVLGDEKI
jgi:hypothetical protein